MEAHVFAIRSHAVRHASDADNGNNERYCLMWPNLPVQWSSDEAGQSAAD